MQRLVGFLYIYFPKLGKGIEKTQQKNIKIIYYRKPREILFIIFSVIVSVKHYFFLHYNCEEHTL